MKNLSDYDSETKAALIGDVNEKDAIIDAKSILVRPFSAINLNKDGQFEFDEKKFKQDVSNIVQQS